MIALILNLITLALVYFILCRNQTFLRENQNNLERWEKLKDKRGYTEVTRLSELCWVKALERLTCLKKDPEVTGVALVMGMLDGSGHAWIEYKRGKDVVQYDPVTEKVIQINEDTCNR